MSVPDPTAVRVALWRALHLEVDAAPPVLADDLGLKLAAPDADWRSRGDMHPRGTARYRAAIVARARFVEDFVGEAHGIEQFVILGAGLDTFAQRRPELAAKLQIFEVDQPATSAWKRGRLSDLGLATPHLVPVDFEAGASWWDEIAKAGFDAAKTAIVVSAGVSMYLTSEANAATLRMAAKLAPGSAYVTTFMLPTALVDAEDRAGYEGVLEAARASGTPFLSFYTPDEMRALVLGSGFRDARHVSTPELIERYFAGRSDDLRPSNGEQIMIATV